MIYVLYALLAGCLIGVFMTVRGEAIKGGLIGMLFGAIVGTAMYWLLGYLGIYRDIRLFQLLIGLLIFGVLTAVTGKT